MKPKQPKKPAKAKKGRPKKRSVKIEAFFREYADKRLVQVFHDGKKIGKGHYYLKQGHASLHVGFVKPPVRRKGIATEILQRLSKMAIKNGARTLGFWTEQDNQGVKKIAEKLRFKLKKVQDVEPGLIPQVYYEKKVRKRK